jgi:hypothetical protein
MKSLDCGVVVAEIWPILDNGEVLRRDPIPGLDNH